MANSGSKVETLALPTFAGEGTFSAPRGISVQIPEGNFKNQIETLSQQPGMGSSDAVALDTARSIGSFTRHVLGAIWWTCRFT
jgi:hypothetical protein